MFLRGQPGEVRSRDCDCKAKDRRPRKRRSGGGSEMPLVQEGWYAPPVHMIKLTMEREITPYVWAHPDDDDRR
jgi:hypothetical protein